MTITNSSDKVTKIGLMCPTCFRKKEFDVELKINKASNNSIDSLMDLAIVISPYYNCDSCGEHMEQIDIDILDDIIALNKSGYKTEFCCSGHNNDPFGLYVIFSDWGIVNDMNEFDITPPKFLGFEDALTSRTGVALRVTYRNFEGDSKHIVDLILDDFHEFVKSITTKKGAV